MPLCLRSLISGVDKKKVKDSSYCERQSQTAGCKLFNVGLVDRAVDVQLVAGVVLLVKKEKILEKKKTYSCKKKKKKLLAGLGLLCQRPGRLLGVQLANRRACDPQGTSR